MPIIRKRAKNTLTAVEMDRGDVLEFALNSGEVVAIKLLATEAEVLRTTLRELGVEEDGGRTDYRFCCVVKVDGVEHQLEREVSTQRSFYEPWVIHRRARCTGLGEGTARPVPDADDRGVVNHVAVGALSPTPRQQHAPCSPPHNDADSHDRLVAEVFHRGSLRATSNWYTLGLLHRVGRSQWSMKGRPT